MATLYNWGIYPKIEARILETGRKADLPSLLEHSTEVIARGNGRCYGDSALQQDVFSTLKLNKIHHFDTQNGRVRAEAGLLLSDILTVIVPAGYFLPVTPGTKFITLGGAVASNIHGKNHHKEGAIARYIESMDILTERGMVCNCSAVNEPELFARTIGGMGLTGIILTVTLRLKKIETSYIRQKSVKAKCLQQILEFFEEYQEYTYSVAWIDCLAKGQQLGRSILMLGEHAHTSELETRQRSNPLKIHSDRQINVPFMFPSFMLNPVSVKLFNTVFYNKQRKSEVNNIIHYDPYFYPLDAVNNWNRIYGGNGFTQYQFVLPFGNGAEGLRKIVQKIAESGTGSFLAVLKTFGEADPGVSSISFPEKGYTLALDFKISKRVFRLLDELDELVLDYGGRLYLTKDARMTSTTFKKMYPVAPAHNGKFQSLQSKRLGL